MNLRDEEDGSQEVRLRKQGIPPPRVVLAKSAEAIENKGVDFFVDAKYDKRVRKGLKRKELSFWKVLESAQVFEKKGDSAERWGSLRTRS